MIVDIFTMVFCEDAKPIVSEYSICKTSKCEKQEFTLLCVLLLVVGVVCPVVDFWGRARIAPCSHGRTLLNTPLNLLSRVYFLVGAFVPNNIGTPNNVKNISIWKKCYIPATASTKQEARIRNEEEWERISILSMLSCTITSTVIRRYHRHHHHQHKHHR